VKDIVNTSNRYSHFRWHPLNILPVVTSLATANTLDVFVNCRSWRSPAARIVIDTRKAIAKTFIPLVSRRFIRCRIATRFLKLPSCLWRRNKKCYVLALFSRRQFQLWQKKIRTEETNTWHLMMTTSKMMAVALEWRYECYQPLRPKYVARPQSKFPTRPTDSKPYIARSDCAYVIEQCCSMAHALTVLPAFSQ
jgi:hypothetical protein